MNIRSTYYVSVYWYFDQFFFSSCNSFQRRQGKKKRWNQRHGFSCYLLISAIKATRFRAKRLRYIWLQYIQKEIKSENENCLLLRIIFMGAIFFSPLFQMVNGPRHSSCWILVDGKSHMWAAFDLCSRMGLLTCNICAIIPFIWIFTSS